MRPIITLIFVWLFVVFAFVQSSSADVVVAFTPAGPDTTAIVSGTIDLTAWSMGVAGLGTGVRLHPLISTVESRLNGSDFYSRSEKSFAPFGAAPGVSFVATPDPGFTVGFGDHSARDQLYLPDGYISASTLSNNYTFSGISFDDLGLTIGDSWGVEFPVFDSAGNTTGATQRMTFQAVAAVPEPGSVLLLSTMAIGFVATSRRRLRTREHGATCPVSPNGQ